MNLVDYMKLIVLKIGVLNANAKNPFIERDYAYNPFESVFNKTYVWVEKQNDKFGN